jgi:hypothetical protein
MVRILFVAGGAGSASAGSTVAATGDALRRAAQPFVTRRDCDER